MSALLRLLAEERACLDALIEAMQAEHAALADSRFEQLPLLAEAKQSVLARLAGIDAARESAQAQAGFTPGTRNPAGDAQHALHAAWQDVLGRAACAARLNREFSAMVHAQLDFTREALSFLRAGSQPVYAADGSRPWRANDSRVTTA